MSVRRFIVSPVACRITPNSAFNLRHQNRKGCRVKWEGSAANMHYSNPEPSMSQLGSFAAGSAETACPQMSALHQYRP